MTAHAIQDSFTFQHEILCAKLTIRDHYSNTILRGIFENTGQILSLVQIQLSIVESQVKDDIRTKLSSSRNLVGKAVYDLRMMSKNLFPENEILSDTGLINALTRELENNSHADVRKKITVKGIPYQLSPGEGVLFFAVILDVIKVVIKEYGSASVSMAIVYSAAGLKIGISYFGKPISLHKTEHSTDEAAMNSRLGIEERLKLIGGQILSKPVSKNRAQINVSIPYHKTRAA